MIAFAATRTAVIGELAAYLDRQVVMIDQPDPRPAYPFLTYSFTGFDPEGGQPARTSAVVPSTDLSFEHDILYTQQSQPTLQLSITALSRDPDQARQDALDALAWFSLHGSDDLKAAGVVVVSAGPVRSRDTLIVGDYERRQGFDVTLRVPSEISRRVATIEEVQAELSPEEGDLS